MVKKTSIAAGALLASAAGFVASYPYHTNFWGGFIHSGCMAAMVGGLADWFAVSALFCKPLGISYRTEIIPRNRERILNEIIAFTGKDLLSPANIMKIVEKYNLAEMAILYLENAEGKEKIKSVAKQISRMIIAHIDAKSIGVMAESLVIHGLKDLQITPVLLNSLRWSVENKYDEGVVRFILDELSWIVQDRSTHEMLCEIIAQVKVQYEGSLKRRQFVSLIFDLSAERLADLAQKELLQYLDSVKDPRHNLRVEFKEWIHRQVNTLEGDDHFCEMVEKWRDDMGKSRLNVAHVAAKYVESKLRAQDSEEETMLLDSVDRWIDQRLANLKESVHQQERLDRKLKSYASRFVYEQHGVIVKIVRDRLSEFSDASLARFVESRIADDLQMIRINGSVVGAAVGMLLFTIAYFAERLW